MQVLNKLFVVGRLAILVALISSAGCATQNVDISSSRQLDVQIENSEMATLTDVEVIEKADGSAWVRGMMVHRANDVGTLKGHVHVEVLDKRGARIEAVKESYRHRVMGTVGRRMTFAARLSAIPPNNAKIIVKHHEDNHAGQLREMIEGL